MNGARFCRNCGREINPAEKFCTTCGAQNVSAPDAGTSYGGGGSGDYQPPQKKTNNTSVGTVAAVVVVALIAIWFFFSHSSIKPEDLNGQWKGTLAIISVDGDKELTRDMDLVNPVDYIINVNLDQEGNGFITDGLVKYTAKYSGGSMKINTNKGLLFGFNTVEDGDLSAGKDGSAYTLNGNIKMEIKDHNNKTATAIATYKLTKPINK